MKKLLIAAAFILLPSYGFGADYAVTFADGAVYSGSLVINGGGTHACVDIQAGSSVDLVNSTLANCADDALNVADDASSTNTAVWCPSDGDCTITIAADKALTGSNNAWRVAPAGDGTDSTTDNVVLTACPFFDCYDNLKSVRNSQLLNAGTGTHTDERGRTGDDIGYWQHMVGMIKVSRKFFKAYLP